MTRPGRVMGGMRAVAAAAVFVAGGGLLLALPGSAEAAEGYTISPTSGQSGTPVMFSGTCDPATYDGALIALSLPDGGILHTDAAVFNPTTGAFSGSLVANPPSGTPYVRASASCLKYNASYALGAQTFTMVDVPGPTTAPVGSPTPGVVPTTPPSVPASLPPSTGPLAVGVTGRQVTVTASGLAPGSGVSLALYLAGPYTLATGRVGAGGTVSLAATLPSFTGRYPVALLGYAPDGSRVALIADIRQAAATAADPAPAVQVLPHTGVAAGDLGWLGSGLLVAGAAAFGAGRRLMNRRALGGEPQSP